MKKILGIILRPSPLRQSWQNVPRGSLLLGLVIAAMPQIVFMIAIFFAGGVPAHPAPGCATVFGVGVSLWMVVGLFYLFSMSRYRGFVTRAECLWLGVFLAYIMPFATLQVLLALFPDKSPTAPHTDVGLFTYLWAGLLLSPFGASGGWFLWRFGVRGSPTPIDDRAFRTQRRRNDLMIGHLVLAAIIASGIPAILIGVELQYLGRGSEIFHMPLILLSPTIAMIELVGFIGLFTVLWNVPNRDIVRRADCLMVGIIVTLALPVASDLVAFAMTQFFGPGIFNFRPRDFDEFIASASFNLLVGTLMMPVGMLSGWIVWRLGVRPARLPGNPLASVFD